MAKFRKWNSPAFNEGEVWVSSSGVKVRIVSVSKHPAAKSNHSSSYEVTYYLDENGDMIPASYCLCYAHEPSECCCATTAWEGWEYDDEEYWDI